MAQEMEPAPELQFCGYALSCRSSHQVFWGFITRAGVEAGLEASFGRAP